MFDLDGGWTERRTNALLLLEERLRPLRVVVRQYEGAPFDTADDFDRRHIWPARSTFCHHGGKCSRPARTRLQDTVATYNQRMVQVRTARAGDRRPISRTLACAFAADPVIRWLMPTRSRDARMFRALAAHVHAAPGCADVALDNGSTVGAALWDPPGHHVPLGQALLGFVWLLTAMGPSSFRRGAVLEAAFALARPTESVWYLAQLGAATPGQGIGSALLEHRLATITGPAYLESSNQRNVPFYQRFGFELVQEISLPRGGPALWTMLRR